MAAPQSTVMQQMAKAKFASFAIRLPTNYQQPQGDDDKQYQRALRLNMPAENVRSSNLFQPQTNNRFHINTTNQLSDQFIRYIDGICSAICAAWAQWQSQAVLTDVVVNGPVASGGKVTGPLWFPLIMALAPVSTPAEARYSKAIGQALSDGWLAYQTSLQAPGAPWYPSFATVSQPMAPPMPNTPTPVSSLTQIETALAKAALQTAMTSNLKDPKAPHHQELFAAIAESFELVFSTWKSTTIVTNVVGTGPVPSFAPPLVPLGPVVGGVGNMSPGGFA